MDRGTLLAISSYGSLLLLFLLHFQPGVIIGASAASVPATVEKTCDKVVSVETVEQMSYLYNVTFKAPTPFSGRWKTVIKFTSPYTYIGVIITFLVNAHLFRENGFCLNIKNLLGTFCHFSAMHDEMKKHT